MELRKPAYDVLCKEAIKRIKALPEEKVTREITEIKEALEQVLNCQDTELLMRYYANIDEFLAVNVDRGLEYLSGDFLLNNK